MDKKDFILEKDLPIMVGYAINCIVDFLLLLLAVMAGTYGLHLYAGILFVWMLVRPKLKERDE